MAVGVRPPGLCHASGAISAAALTSAATWKIGARSWNTFPVRGARRCATAYVDHAMAASITRMLPVRVPPPPPGSGPPVLTVATPATVSALPRRRRAVRGWPSTRRARVTLATWPKLTSRPATAAVVRRRPELKKRKSIPSATPASSDQPSRGSQRVSRPPSTRKQSAAAPRRVTLSTSGEKPPREAFVATGARPQQAAAQVPRAKPARRAWRWSGVTRVTKHEARAPVHGAMHLGGRSESDYRGAATAHVPLPPRPGARGLRTVRPRRAGRGLRLQLPRPADSRDPRRTHPSRPRCQRCRAGISLRHRVRRLLRGLRHPAGPPRRRVGPPQADRARAGRVESHDGAVGLRAQLPRAGAGADRRRHRRGECRARRVLAAIGLLSPRATRDGAGGVLERNIPRRRAGPR